MKSRVHDALRPIVEAVHSLLKTAPEAQAFLRDWPPELIARPIDARSLPVVGALRGLSRYAAPRTHPLVEAIAAVAGELDWRQTYAPADFGARFLENYGFSEWIGQRGAVLSDKIACGVLVLGPDTEYPAHSHEAEELYLPLAGRAWWRSGASDWRLREPGEWIYHSPWMIHAMRTGREPLLAAYLWRAGDLTAKSRIGEIP
jgi:histidine ammonia-lyase